MKKIIAIMLAVVLFVSFFSYGEKNTIIKKESLDSNAVQTAIAEKSEKNREAQNAEKTEELISAEVAALYAIDASEEDSD